MVAENYMYGDVYSDHSNIEVSPSEYGRLKRDARFLKALHDAGVHQWKGYELALKIFDTFKGSNEDSPNTPS